MMNAEKAINHLIYLKFAHDLDAQHIINKEALDFAIKAIEQEPILDKIRAEIDGLLNDEDNHMYAHGVMDCLEIIDKHKAESEDKKMTREEAIDIFEHNWTRLENYDYTEEELNEALNMAIKALEQEPCEDAISRQAVLDIWHTTYSDNREENEEIQYKKIAFELPSVNTQEPKTGHWIEVIDDVNEYGNKTYHHECSECGSNKSGWGEYDYCPDCGAKMVESQEIEVEK